MTIELQVFRYPARSAAGSFIVANVAGWLTGIAGLVLAVLAGMLLSSVASRHCPLYTMIGIKKTI